jgi:ribonuclease HII
MLKKELLLHVCCAPCATSVFEALKNDFRITAFFYNPNIQPYAEYHKRREQVEFLCRRQNIKLVLPEHDEGCWVEQTSGLENAPEGGNRCRICFEIRISRTLSAARDMGITTVATTLSVSPHKDVRMINEIGSRASVAISNIIFLQRDFKQNDGYRKSCELSRTYGLYRQNYCGCLYSLPSKSTHGTDR